jgi:phage gp29-like protein
MPKIIDQYGNPMDRAVLAEPQTAHIAALQHHLVESHLDGLTPARAARILKQADLGDITAQHQLFDDMLERDPHLRCEFDKRKGAVLGLDWSIEPPAHANRAEKKAAAWAEEILRDAVDDLEDVILTLMDGVGHGFAPVELEWQRWGQELLPRFHPRPQTWFRLSRDRRALRLADGSPDGAEPLAMGWILHQHQKVKTGYLGRAGLFRTVLWPFMYKSYSIGDFAEFLETYGLPIIVGKYMSGSSPDEKASLMRAVSALGHDARAIMPDGMSLEIQQVTGSATGGHHLAMVDWADRAQSKAILGQVLSAEAKATGLGSGVADLHAEVRRDILKSDARQIAGTLTRDLVYPLIALNLPGIDGYRRCPRWLFDTGEAEDLKLYADSLPTLAQNGARIPVAWVHEKLRIPEAAEGEAVFGAAPDPTPAPTPAPGKAALKAAPLAPPALDYADRALGQLGTGAAPHVSAWLTHLAALVEQAASLEQIQDAILDAYGHLPADELVALMETAFAAAELAGRAAVAGESGSGGG